MTNLTGAVMYAGTPAVVANLWNVRGKIDLLIHYQNVTYEIELKSFTDHTGYGDALKQAAGYGKHLRLDHIYLVFFIESIDEKHR